MLTTRQLTKGERILVIRRRNDLSQSAAATERGVSLWQYRQWEADEGTIPDVLVGPLLSYEACFVMRRRAGYTIAEIAEEMDVCNYWVTRMERGEVVSTRLTEYWS